MRNCPTNPCPKWTMAEPTEHLLAEQFDDLEQQHHAAELGMWTFLATEVLFFGGLFTAYATYRHIYPAGFAAASRETNVMLGSINTAILLTSSLTMALAVHAVQSNRAKALVRYLGLTVLFAAAFLGVKAVEYHEDFVKHLVPGHAFAPGLPEGAKLFFVLYWIMTGLHGLHVLIGIGVLGVLAIRVARRNLNPNAIEISGLYWHFVDIVWIFLYPLLYLIDLHP